MIDQYRVKLHPINAVGELSELTRTGENTKVNRTGFLGVLHVIRQDYFFSFIAVVFIVFALLGIDQIHNVMYQIPLPAQVSGFDYILAVALTILTATVPLFYFVTVILVVPRPRDVISNWLVRISERRVGKVALRHVVLLVPFLLLVFLWFTLSITDAELPAYWMLALWILLLALPIFDLLLAIFVVRRERFHNRSFLEYALDLFVMCDRRQTAARSFWIGIAVILASSVFWLALFFWDENWQILRRPMRLSFSMLGWAIGIWFMYPFVKGKIAALFARPELVNPRPYIRRMIGRALFAFLVFNAVLELMWFAPELFPAYFSYRTYTIWAAFHLLFGILFFARLIDAAQVHAKLPLLRTFTLFVLVALFSVLLFNPKVGEHVTDSNRTANRTLSAIADAWFKSFEDKIAQTSANYPVFVVAASGGGSRAALFTSLMYAQLSQIELDQWDTDKAKQSNETTRSRTIADQIVLISSVSGGSLATAHYLSDPSQYAAKNLQAPYVLKNSMRTEIIQRMSGIIHELRDYYRDENEEGLAALAEKTANVCRRIATDKQYGWILKSAPSDDMCTDFMAPLLRGAILPNFERGDAVSTFWQKRFHWHTIDNFSRSHAATKDNRAKPPIVLFNATEVNTGSRMIVGFPSLPYGLCRIPVLALTDIDSKHKVALAETVRLSANFPYAFEIPHMFPRSSEMRLDIRKRMFDELPTSYRKRREIPLPIVDGGIVDNTGIDSIVHVFEQLKTCAEDKETLNNALESYRVWDKGERAAYAKKLHERSKKIFDLLKKRGVVLIEIDSGLRPERPGVIARWLSPLFKPLEALEKSIYTNYFDKAKQQNFETLRELFTLPEPTQANGNGRSAVPLSAFHAEWHFSVNHRRNVMTAWALGPEDKATVFAYFVFEMIRKIDSRIQCLKELFETNLLRDSDSEEKRQLWAEKIREINEKCRKLNSFEKLEDTIVKQAEVNVSQKRIGMAATETKMIPTDAKQWLEAKELLTTMRKKAAKRAETATSTTFKRIGALVASDKRSATIEQPKEIHRYSVKIGVPGFYTIETHGQTDVVMTLFDKNRMKTIAEDDDSGNGLNAKIERRLAAGDYLVEVRHYSPYATGEYLISMTRKLP